MTNSTARVVSRKLDENWRVKLGLHPQFPLFPHQSGRWAKKVRRQLKYFGKVEDDPKGKKALEQWNRVKDDLIAGRTPREAQEGLIVRRRADGGSSLGQRFRASECLMAKKMKTAGRPKAACHGLAGGELFSSSSEQRAEKSG